MAELSAATLVLISVLGDGMSGTYFPDLKSCIKARKAVVEMANEKLHLTGVTLVGEGKKIEPVAKMAPHVTEFLSQGSKPRTVGYAMCVPREQRTETPVEDDDE